ncbi:hypothetical protein D9M68_736910 [compost metagenome]
MGAQLSRAASCKLIRVRGERLGLSTCSLQPLALEACRGALSNRLQMLGEAVGQPQRCRPQGLIAATDQLHHQRRWRPVAAQLDQLALVGRVLHHMPR